MICRVEKSELLFLVVSLELKSMAYCRFGQLVKNVDGQQQLLLLKVLQMKVMRHVASVKRMTR